LEVVDGAGVSEDFVAVVVDSVFAPEASFPPEPSPDSPFFFGSPLPAELLPLLA